MSGHRGPVSQINCAGFTLGVAILHRNLDTLVLARVFVARSLPPGGPRYAGQPDGTRSETKDFATRGFQRKLPSKLYKCKPCGVTLHQFTTDAEERLWRQPGRMQLAADDERAGCAEPSARSSYVITLSAASLAPWRSPSAAGSLNRQSENSALRCDDLAAPPWPSGERSYQVRRLIPEVAQAGSRRRAATLMDIT